MLDEGQESAAALGVITEEYGWFQLLVALHVWPYAASRAYSG
jgi:hypothetical protein